MDRSALLARGAEEAGAGRLAAAEATYRSMLGDAEALSNLGAVLNIAERHEAAEAACRAALAAQPDYWAALGNLGTALHHQQRHDEAVAAYVAALHSNPCNPDACTNLGVALAEQWRMPDSLAFHEIAVTLAPGHAEMRCNRVVCVAAGRELQAASAAQKPGRLPSVIAGTRGR